METIQRNASLLTLAKDNKWQELKAVIELGADISHTNMMGQSALHIASLWGSLEAIEVLLSLGAQVNRQNSRGATPLHFAACAKRQALQACQLLLDGGADPNLPDALGMLPYERAVTAAVRQLLGGPDPRLFLLAQEGRAEELRALLDSGDVTSVRVVDDDGRHALNLAVESGSLDTVKLLLDTDPEMVFMPDMSGNTSLHTAATAGKADVLGLLLTRLPPLDMQNLNPSEYARGNWVVHDEPIEPLDATPLHCAVEAGEVECVEALLKAGANPNILNFDGCSPLHLAVQAQDEELAELLLRHGADAGQPNKDFTSVLHCAAQSGPPSLLRLLLQHPRGRGGVAATNERGWAPLHLAARGGSAPKVELLLAAGAPVGQANAQGSTPLHLAALNGHAQVVQLLLDAGGDRGAANAEGKTPAGVAKSPQVQQLLALV